MYNEIWGGNRHYGVIQKKEPTRPGMNCDSNITEHCDLYRNRFWGSTVFFYLSVPSLVRFLLIGLSLTAHAALVELLAVE